MTAGDVPGTVAALQVAFRSQGGGALANLVRVVPMQAINSVLVIANQPSYIEDARRVFTLVERGRRQTVRSWHVYYLQNSRSNDVAYVLQQAFTPGHVTAVPTPDRQHRARIADQPSGRRRPGRRRLGGGGLGGGGRRRAAAAPGRRRPRGGGGLTASATGRRPAGPARRGHSGPGRAGGGQSAAGRPRRALDQTDTSTSTATMRIIPNNPNNAVLIYGTPEEAGQAEAMLRKIDILPLQVLIEAVIAEVTLNDDLQIRHAVLLQVAQRQHRLQQHHGERDRPLWPPRPFWLSSLASSAAARARAAHRSSSRRCRR